MNTHFLLCIEGFTLPIHPFTKRWNPSNNDNDNDNNNKFTLFKYLGGLFDLWFTGQYRQIHEGVSVWLHENVYTDMYITIGTMQFPAAGLIDDTSIDSSIFVTGKFFKEQSEEKKENIYSDIDKAIEDSQKTEE